MPAYVAPPLGKAIALLPGVVGYSFGGFNDRTPPARLSIQSVAVASNVVTLNVTLLEGLIPLVGQLITVRGLQTAAAMNVTNVAIASVSINSTTGIGTITYAATTPNIGTTTDSGLAIVPVAETTDTMANGSGQQFAMQAAGGLASNSRDIGWSVEATGGATFTANLQVADVDLDAAYTTIASVTAAGQQTAIGVRANFVRGNLSGVSGGTSPGVIFKILV
jgi:hypothetical protein